MKKVALLFILLAGTFALAQQPQWQVVQSVVLYNQGSDIPITTLFTPTQQGVYRINMYFSVVGGSSSPKGDFTAYYMGTDVSGYAFGDGADRNCGVGGHYSSPQIIVSLQANQPFDYLVKSNSTPSSGCAYNLALTVEQLQ